MMKSFKARYVISALILLVVGVILGVNWSQEHTDTAEQLKKLEEAFLVINKRYVEEVDPAPLAEVAIKAMIASLDPHSSYIDAEAFQEVDESYRGSFGGIGIWFEIPRGDTAHVVSIIEGGPSEKVGLRPGDRIIAVDDTSIVGVDQDEVRSRLKGPVGTAVHVTVKRLGITQPLEFVITRDQIPLYSVTSAYLVDPRTGYVKISRFAQTTYREFVQSVIELKRQGMQRLIIDVRDNSGGIMEVAAAIVDEIIAGDAVIVSTRGRAVPSQTLQAGRPGILEDEPVMVLVNRNSASASEILAGALQDHDRGLIVGERTFGKGLVQNQFELPDESRLQMTTARYFTPSGRLIQTPYEDGEHLGYLEDKYRSLRDAVLDPENYLSTIPDSLKFSTTHGRVVFGGGGVFPDYVVSVDTMMSPVLRLMYGGDLFEPFRVWFTGSEQALRSRWEESPGAYAENYTFSPAAWEAFWKAAASSQVPITLTDNPDAASLADRVIARADTEANRDVLERYLKALLARQLYGSREAYPYFNDIDQTFQEAQTLWELAEELPGVR